MKEIIFSLILGVALGVSGIASASTVISIHVEWGYTPPTEPAIVFFGLISGAIFRLPIDFPIKYAAVSVVKAITKISHI